MESSMGAFRAIWVAPSIILGLGLTRLLSNCVLLFRARGQAVMDWVPLVWAACIFTWQVQYLWSIIELPRLIHTWTLLHFLLLIGLSFFLFVAAALVLPDSKLEKDQCLKNVFRQDGRWALLALSAWSVNAVLVDCYLFDLPFLSHEVALLATLFSLPLLYLSTNSRRWREVITVLNFGITIWSAWEFSPKSY